MEENKTERAEGNEITRIEDRCLGSSFILFFLLFSGQDDPREISVGHRHK